MFRSKSEDLSRRRLGQKLTTWAIRFSNQITSKARFCTYMRTAWGDDFIVSTENYKTPERFTQLAKLSIDRSADRLNSQLTYFFTLLLNLKLEIVPERKQRKKSTLVLVEVLSYVPVYEKCENSWLLKYVSYAPPGKYLVYIRGSRYQVVGKKWSLLL